MTVKRPDYAATIPRPGIPDPRAPRTILPIDARAAVQAAAGLTIPGPNFWYGMDLGAVAAGVTQPASVRIHQDKGFVCTHLCAAEGPDATFTSGPGGFSDFRLRLASDSDSRGLSSDSIRADFLCGSIREPLALPTPWYLRPGETVTVEGENIAAGARNLQVFLAGFHVVPTAEDAIAVRRKPFFYVIRDTSGAASRLLFTRIMHQDAPWAWIWISGRTDDAAGPDRVALRFAEGSEGRSYSNLDIPFRALLRDETEAPSGQSPYYLSFPMVWAPNRELQLTVQNLTSGPGVNIAFELIFGGVKLYDAVGMPVEAIARGLAWAGSV